jgi:spore coat protein U-like protein
MRKILVSTGAVVLVSLVFAATATAQTASTTFDVSITIENSCTVAVDDLSFGSVTDLTAAVPASTTGTVTCTATAPVAVSFDAGTGGTSTFAIRQMASGANTIDFNLYRDAPRTEILGDATGGTVTIGLTSTGGADGFTVYGQTVAAQSAKPPSTYTSIITATVTF